MVNLLGLPRTDCTLTYSTMTLKSMVFVHSLTWMIHSTASYLLVLMTSVSGWVLTACSWMQPRLTSYSAVHSGKVDQLPTKPVNVCGSSITPSYEISVYGSTVVTPCPLTSPGCRRQFFATLRQLRSIHRSLSQECFTRLVVALVLSRLDFCTDVLAGLPKNQLNQLQSVLHAAARLISATCQWDYVAALAMTLAFCPRTRGV